MELQYRAYNMQGEVLKGVIEGAHERDIIDKLGERDLMVVELKAVEAKVLRAKRAHLKVSAPALASVTRQMSTMLRAGLSLMKCLNSLKMQTKDRKLRTVLGDVALAVESGASFSDALHLHTGVFTTIYIGMVQAGESGGALPEALDRMASYLESNLRLRQRIRSAMMYPLIVGVLGIGICLFMITVIIPVFVDIFKEFQSKLPLPTLILIRSSAWLRAHLVACLAGAVVAFFVFRRLRRTRVGALLWDRLALRVPVLGPLAKKIALSRFSRTFATLTHSGVPILKTLDIAALAVDNLVLEAAIRKVAEHIEKGATIHQAMASQKIFPPMLLDMVSAGEQTGAVDQMLTHVANHYDGEIETTLSGLTSLLEPLLILFLGVVVGGVVIAMFLPIFKMTDAIKF